MGLRLEEISEQISEKLLHHTPQNVRDHDVRKDYDDVLNRLVHPGDQIAGFNLLNRLVHPGDQ